MIVMMNKMPRAALFAAAIFTGALSLAGCASSSESRAARERNPAPCPNVVILTDAARIVEFDGEEETLENVAFTGEMKDVSLACRYFSDKPIDAAVKLEMAFGRGPKAEAREAEFTYFVAVTRKDLELIEKVEYTIPVKFDSKSNIKTISQNFDEIIIPRTHNWPEDVKRLHKHHSMR